jgi:3-hydroxyisobutyrate dehydrogenase-like beta-hydroxyacid dehydrogenase
MEEIFTPLSGFLGMVGRDLQSLRIVKFRTNGAGTACRSGVECLSNHHQGNWGMTTIGVIGMGAMGAAVARRIVENGGRVVTDVAGRSPATVNRARDAGAETVTAEELVAQSEMVLSIIPPSSAPVVSKSCFNLLKASSARPLFIDFNAIAPQTLHAIAEPFLADGLPFGDGSIIGSPPVTGRVGPRFYMSGQVGEAGRTLRRLGLDVRLLSDGLGDASGLKMAYAGINKGMIALASAIAIGAARSGALESLIAELKESQPAMYDRFRGGLPGMYSKAYRWDGEMEEIARFLEPEAGAATMFHGASALYEHIAEADREGPDSEIIAILDRFTGRR